LEVGWQKKVEAFASLITLSPDILPEGSPASSLVLAVV
jgi:hypothetical protein